MAIETEKDLIKAYIKSMGYLESMSALDLMKNAGLFMKDLKKLVNSQRLPAAILTGCLMEEIHRLNIGADDLLLDSMLSKSFRLFKRYVDEKFMKKE